jgi:demethylmenaquinone methyltransferase/2-methoxy-6-polyprenyl-1,4-benzoquinol methylase
MSRPVVPYEQSQTDKKQQVARMFDKIAGTYDFLNHFLSLGIDILWRKRTIRALKPYKPREILDVATGTGDLAIEMNRLQPDRIIGMDIANQMLDKGREKLHKKGLTPTITFEYGDSENLAYETDQFDAVTVAFGVRNFEHLDAGLAEMQRVLKPGGVAAILEFSRPRVFPLKQLYQAYFQNVLPLLGRLFSSDPAAYRYLPDSVMAFPDGEAFLAHLTKNGFTKTQWYPLTFGIASLYLAEKP